MLLNRQDEALETYRKGLERRRRSLSTDEGNLEWQRDLSVAHTRIGSVLLRQGKRDEALAEYRAGLSIDREARRCRSR